MKLIRLELNFIRSYKTLKYNIETTKVLIGQNDHGKSSILKVLNIVFNEINDEMIDEGLLSPDIAEKLLTIFSTNAKARRITLVYFSQNQEYSIHITIRTDFTFIIHDRIERGTKTNETVKNKFKKLREKNKFILIPALRDVTSNTFLDLFSDTLNKFGLDNLIPKVAGGTTKRYRKLKKIKEDISTSIKPYIDDTLLPALNNIIGINPQHPLALTFEADINSLSMWIRNNLKLAFQLDENKESTLPLSEAGTGIQSVVLLALHQLDKLSISNPDINYYFSIEEPESFLHPQKQVELYNNILKIEKNNVNFIMTTHSPFIVSQTNFSRLGLVRKEDKYSYLFTPKFRDKNEEEILNAYSNDVNSLIFFAEKIILVEGESDKLVIQTLLKKIYSNNSSNISVISASGNQNFCPYLKMIKSWGNLKMPLLIITDFDSLTVTTDRAILRGIKEGGYSLSVNNEAAINNKIDQALDRDEATFTEAANFATEILKQTGINVFVFTSDLEYSLISDGNKNDVVQILNQNSPTHNDYGNGYSLLDLKSNIGSKNIPLNSMSNPPFKKPFIHKKIANTININDCSNDISRLINAIKNL